MDTSGCKNYGRSKNFRSRSIAWVAHVMIECHVKKKQFKFWRKDGSFMYGEQLVRKSLMVLGAYHAGIERDVLCRLYQLSRRDWQKIVDCFNQQPIDKQAKACMTASRTIAKYAQRPRRQTV